MILNIAFNVSVGKLTDIKLKKLENILSKKFPSGVVANNQLILSSNSERIVIEQNRIVYTSNRSIDDDIYDIFNEVFELLMIDKIDTEEVVLTKLKSDKEYSMDYLKNKFNALLDDSIGIGIRNFFEYNGCLSEIKVEPYFNEPNKLYIEGRYPILNVNIQQNKKVINEVINDYNNKVERLNV